MTNKQVNFRINSQLGKLLSQARKAGDKETMDAVRLTMKQNALGRVRTKRQ